MNYITLIPQTCLRFGVLIVSLIHFLMAFYDKGEMQQAPKINK